jgi:hypothetical protein
LNDLRPRPPEALPRANESFSLNILVIGLAIGHGVGGHQLQIGITRVSS